MKFYEKAEEVANKILNAFQTGKIPAALAPIFIKHAGRHCDAYSWMNRMLVALAGYSDAMGFKQWLAVGRVVRKGEKAFYILSPCIKKIDDAKNPGEKRPIIYGFKVAHVFGIEQTDVINAELWAKHNKQNEESEKFLDTLPLREVAEKWGLKLAAFRGSEHGAKGWYRHGTSIALGVENLSTWAHELIHAADFKAGKLVERGQNWRSETVAELGGAILMMVMGYETDADLGGAWEYISHYANEAGIEPIKACMDVIKRTCEAVELILETANSLSGQEQSTTAAAA